jgi:fructokinase
VIVVAAEALIDLLVHPDGRLVATPGGGPFNTARTVARLGLPVAFLGRLSDDGFGRTLRAALAGDGVDLSLIESTSAPTTLAIAELDDAGVAAYRFHTAETSAPGLSADAVHAAMARDPQALHIGSLGLVLEPMARALVDGVTRAAPTTLP